MSFTGGLPLNAILTWGAQSISTSVGTRVIPPGYTSQALNTQTPRGYRAPRTGVLRNFTARHNTANGNGTSVQYVVRLNGVNTLLNAALATGAIGSVLNDSQVNVVEGDLVECVRITVANIGNDLLEAICACEFMGGPLPAGSATV